MRIGLSGGGRTPDRMIEQAQKAEADGFTSLWYASAVGGDPLVAMALAGRATTTIELGTSVLQTYTSHPALMACGPRRWSPAWADPGSPWASGRPTSRSSSPCSATPTTHPGRHTEEYVRVLTALLRDGSVDFDGEDFRVHVPRGATVPDPPVPVLVAALAPRLLRVAGEAGRRHHPLDGHGPGHRDARRSPDPRRGRGGRSAGAADRGRAAGGGARRRRRGPPDRGGRSSPGTACCRTTAGCSTSERPTARPTPPSSATRPRSPPSVEALFEAGATDVWAAAFPVGDDRKASTARTRALLQELANRP